ncbi:energy-coupling factor transporter transmembrane component T [Gemmiger sp. An194]|uniref:energy-coupling factor transporter transmembrane component T family protein n=1 Tax=Gemmiger sp. An194 TaxID=1965582 RepID=UPI000B37B698|nr:energy-coupling factor transporter transmembrane component T [Gemmiger sp. An194]OUP25107.1 hypothetical protein B5F28_04185 [Gemmiger sp. An194]
MRALNSAYKLLTLIIASLMLSVTYNTRLDLVVAGCCFLVTLCTPRVDRKFLFISLTPFLIAAFGMFMTGLLFPSQAAAQGVETAVFGQRVIYASSLKSACQLAARVLAFGGLGMLFAFTTEPMELIMSLMQQFHLPPKFAYGILAAYHFFPVVRSEFGTVGVALRVRGVKATPFSPKRILPMLVHALERSQSLAMAMESRGFQNDAPRAVAFRVRFGWADIAFLIGLPAALLVGLWLL